MKRCLLSVFLIVCTLLCACAAESENAAMNPTEKTEATLETTTPTEVTTEQTEESTDFIFLEVPQENSAFAAYKTFDMDSEVEGGFWGGTIGVIVNEPFVEELAPTITWREGEYDRLYIIPRFVGSRVYVYEMLWDEKGELSYSEEVIYSAVAEDGCVIYGSFDRPEGMDRWYVEIISPFGITDGLSLSYNGNTGTPHLEYLEGWFLTAEKPVIYLYPEEETEVTVKLDYQGQLTRTYPAYENGWTVTAQPDGTLLDRNGQTYNYLYWEGEGAANYDFSKGFCVAGKDTAAFLENALEQLGLNRREANEFIVYWLPIMERNPYNIISFQRDAYTETAPLDIQPTPDTLIRVYMAWYGSDEATEITPQELTAPERTGFTVVEWGGCQVR